MAWFIPLLMGLGRVGLMGGVAGVADKATGGLFFDSIRHSYHSVVGGGNPANMTDQRASNMVQLVQNLENQGKDVHIDMDNMTVSAISQDGNLDFYVFTTKSGIHKVHGKGKADSAGVGFSPTMPEYTADSMMGVLKDLKHNSFGTSAGDVLTGSTAVHAELVDVTGAKIAKPVSLLVTADELTRSYKQHFADKAKYQAEVINGLTGDLNALARQASPARIIDPVGVDKQLSAFENATGLKFSPSLSREQKLAGMAEFVNTIGIAQHQYDKLGFDFKKTVTQHYPDVEFKDITKQLTRLPGLTEDEQKALIGKSTAAAAPAGAAKSGGTSTGKDTASDTSKEEVGFLARMDSMSPVKKLIVGVVLMVVGPIIGSLAGIIPGIGGAAKGLVGFAAKGGGLAMLLQGGGEVIGMNPMGWLKDQASGLVGDVAGKKTETVSAPPPPVSSYMPQPEAVRPLEPPLKNRTVARAPEPTR